LESIKQQLLLLQVFVVLEMRDRDGKTVTRGQGPLEMREDPLEERLEARDDPTNTGSLSDFVRVPPDQTADD
jgi:hypothetical protein